MCTFCSLHDAIFAPCALPSNPLDFGGIDCIYLLAAGITLVMTMTRVRSVAHRQHLTRPAT